MDAGARLIHVDVMDGHFVPPITIGPLVAASIADQVHDAGGALDVHLMIERPERQIAEFAKAGADSITIHAEATAARKPHPGRDPRARLPGRDRDQPRHPGRGGRASCAALADIVLCMTVNPGWGGQPFIDSSPDKVARLRPLAGEAAIEVDGGIDAAQRRLGRGGRRVAVRRRLGGVRGRRPGRRLHARSPLPPAPSRPSA